MFLPALLDISVIPIWIYLEGDVQGTYDLGTLLTASSLSDAILYIVTLFIFLFLIIPSGIYLITAPRVLAPIAEGLIVRLDLAYLLFIPMLDDDLTRNKTFEFIAGSPVADVRINESFNERLWWISSQMRPEMLLGGVPKSIALKWGDLPRSLMNAGMPVGGFAGLIVRQWFLFMSQIVYWSSCCGSVSCGCGLLVVPLILYRIFMLVHGLAYAAAYCRILTDSFPWQRAMH